MTKLRHKSQLLQLPRMFRAGGHEINPCGVDGGVPQDIRQLHDIPADLIKGRGKQMPEVVWKNF